MAAFVTAYGVRRDGGGGQVMDGGVPTRLRVLLDANPGGLKLPPTTTTTPSQRPVQGGQCCFDPGRWDAAEDQSPIKSVPPGRERGQEFRSHSE